MSCTTNRTLVSNRRRCSCGKVIVHDPPDLDHSPGGGSGNGGGGDASTLESASTRGGWGDNPSRAPSLSPCSSRRRDGLYERLYDSRLTRERRMRELAVRVEEECTRGWTFSPETNRGARRRRRRRSSSRRGSGRGSDEEGGRDSSGGGGGGEGEGGEGKFARRRRSQLETVWRAHLCGRLCLECMKRLTAAPDSAEKRRELSSVTREKNDMETERETDEILETVVRALATPKAPKNMHAWTVPLESRKDVDDSVNRSGMMESTARVEHGSDGDTMSSDKSNTSDRATNSFREERQKNGGTVPNNKSDVSPSAADAFRGEPEKGGDAVPTNISDVPQSVSDAFISDLSKGTSELGSTGAFRDEHEKDGDTASTNNFFASQSGAKVFRDELKKCCDTVPPDISDITPSVTGNFRDEHEKDGDNVPTNNFDVSESAPDNVRARQDISPNTTQTSSCDSMHVPKESIQCNQDNNSPVASERAEVYQPPVRNVHGLRGQASSPSAKPPQNGSAKTNVIDAVHVVVAEKSLGTTAGPFPLKWGRQTLIPIKSDRDTELVESRDADNHVTGRDDSGTVSSRDEQQVESYGCPCLEWGGYSTNPAHSGSMERDGAQSPGSASEKDGYSWMDLFDRCNLCTLTSPQEKTKKAKK